MLSSSYLQKLAIKYQTPDININREYGQHVLLSYLFQKPEAKDLYFKGGTALRLLYRSPRFSEDLDFDTTVHTSGIWENILQETLIDVSREGIEVDIKESKTTSGGYLCIVLFKNIGQPITIHLEISFRKDVVPGEIFTVENDFVSLYPVKSLSTFNLIEGKFHALFDRQKARDFYDIYFLLRANLLTPDQKKQLYKVKQLLSKTTLSFDRELSLFLPKSQILMIRDFRNALEREIERNS
ncbi:MAG: nucleotidyl transferase AbiEii/AbiGii toxin family protein [Candidatus Gottesmanbacteria bacterium]|nr:nucleotidyl transferase AbiEii/AbiGii toxin family protein [Candidatus Gottesmanbacteria bacterium]